MADSRAIGFSFTGINTVFFDMGSTLARLRPGWQGIYHQVFQQAGFDLPLEEVEAAISHSWGIVASEDATAEFIASLEGNRQWQREVEERVMERLNIHPPVREEVFWSIIKAFEDPASYELYPDALPTLTALKAAGYRLAIISNWGWHLPELCETLGLTPHFEQIFTSARLGVAKPNPRIFQYALETLDVRPDEAIHIGDSFAADIVGASNVGIRPLWLVRPAEQPLYDEARLKLLPEGVEASSIGSLTEVLQLLGVKTQGN